MNTIQLEKQLLQSKFIFIIYMAIFMRSSEHEE